MIHLVLSFAISCGWPICQIDVQNAFLHGWLSKDVYMIWFNPPASSIHNTLIMSANYTRLCLGWNKLLMLGFLVLVIVSLSLDFLVLILTTPYSFVVLLNTPPTSLSMLTIYSPLLPLLKRPHLSCSHFELTLPPKTLVLFTSSSTWKPLPHLMDSSSPNNATFSIFYAKATCLTPNRTFSLLALWWFVHWSLLI